MRDLKKYYGRNLVYVITELKNGKIETRQEIKTVYNPLDFTKRIAPCSGCDLVIGDNSTNSDLIYDFGFVGGNTSGFSFGRFDSITLFNYCELDQVEQVKNDHLNVIKNALNEFVTNEQKRIDNVKQILKTICDENE